MDALTLRSTVRKSDLKSYMANIKTMYEDFDADPPESTRIKTFENDGMEYCVVTSRGYFTTAAASSIH